ncbi:MAG: hypothetical protein KDA69_12255 [Planctomycetaceae bacterium]|nr:hypothetical protein [Planctomycetaceae bacterium]MCA9030880.1 hypothetical protein [Planctomycetaceae bacterium]MCA9045089.1 hypothetical protein [Planctomycetaceae bacterium]MCB9951846.1 hypothetical protein [Planctomycetaceae bacterium]
MAKKKAAIEPGMQVRIRPGATMPEYESLEIGGWAGRVMEVLGRGAKQTIIVEWDNPTTELIPAEYRNHCELQGLFYGMACVAAADVEAPAES